MADTSSLGLLRQARKPGEFEDARNTSAVGAVCDRAFSPIELIPLALIRRTTGAHRAPLQYAVH
jgi:hypothetical protein